MNIEGVLKIALRNFKKNITTTLIKIIGLVISLAAVVIIWAFIINENKFDKGITGSERIYRLDAPWASMAPYIGHLINQNLADQVIATRFYFRNDVGIQVNNTPFNLKNLAYTDSTFFKTFPIGVIAGIPKDALIRPFSMVLTESHAKRLFASTDVIGKRIRLEDQFDFTVTAVIKDQPFLHFKIDVLASIESLEQIRYKGVLKEFDGWSYPTYLRIPDESRAQEYEAKINELLKKFSYVQSFTLNAFDKIYYSPEVESENNTKHGNLLYNKILISVSIFVLLLAAINFINLTIANAVARSKEVSIKKLQGATLFQLISQFVFETVIIILISIIISGLLLWFLNPLLNSLTGFPVHAVDFWTGTNLVTLAAGLLIFTLITALYPSLYISSYSINSNKKTTSGFSKHNGIRNGLIIFQNLVSITLICCTVIANQQFRYMNRKDLGFKKNDIVNLKINSQLKGHLDLFKETLLKYPEITSVSYSGRIPGNYWGSWCCITIEGKENRYFENAVDPDYLKTLGIRIKEGRNFSVDNPGDKGATYLINETAIKLYDLKDPVGQILTNINGMKGQIVGTIYDFHYRGLNYEQTPLLLYYAPVISNYINIKIANSNVAGAIGRLKETWEELCPSFAFEYNFLDDTYNLQYLSEKRFEKLLFAFALLALFIASIGLLGLSIHSTERRTKEIGIRKINGAKVSEVMVMLNSDFLKWVGIAFVISCPIAWFAMTKWLNNFAFRTEISWWIYLLSGVIAFGVSLATVSFQSWRAATRNPVEALRYE